MFQLNNFGTYFWYRIFCILSLEKADDFLHIIGFPLPHKGAAVEKLAQDFVLRLYEIYPQGFVSGVSHGPTPQVKDLFDEIYNILSGELGVKGAELIIIWGNQLQALDELRPSIFVYRSELVSLELGASIANFALPALQDQLLQWLISTIRQFRTESKGIDSALDELEKSPKDAWESKMFAMVNYDTRPDEISLGMYDWLYVLIDDCKTRSLLITIKNQFNTEEFEILDRWIQSQPSWIRVKSLPSPSYHHLYDLKELLEKM